MTNPSASHHVSPCATVRDNDGPMDLFTSTPLLERADDLRERAADAVPAGVAAVVERRVRTILGLDIGAPSSPAEGSDESTVDPDAAAVVVDVVEQFMIDVHGLTDERFARLGDHFTDAEQVAIMFHLALVDGFAKMELAAGTSLPGSSTDAGVTR